MRSRERRRNHRGGGARGVAARGRFMMAVSGGRTPWKMLRALADERCHGPTCTSCRSTSASRRREIRTETSRICARVCSRNVRSSRAGSCHAGGTADLEAAANDTPDAPRDRRLSAVLDLAHLGLGPDGHTASLVPGDPVLDVTSADVALTGIYQGRRRMTLTYPMLNRSRRIFWLVTGHEKADMLLAAADGDRSIPAGRISRRAGRRAGRRGGVRIVAARAGWTSA